MAREPQAAEIVSRERAEDGSEVLTVRCGTGHPYTLVIKPSTTTSGHPNGYMPIIGGRAYRYRDEAQSAGIAAIERIVNNAPEQPVEKFVPRRARYG